MSHISLKSASNVHAHTLSELLCLSCSLILCTLWFLVDTAEILFIPSFMSQTSLFSRMPHKEMKRDHVQILLINLAFPTATLTVYSALMIFYNGYLLRNLAQRVKSS